MEVSARDIERIKADCQIQNLPLIEEFEYKKDVDTPELKIELKSTTQVRDYQEQSLAKMFSHGRARSGIIVLPCGAGKTLTGITAASYIKRSVLVLCNSNVSVEQWRQQFYQWANMQGSPVVAFTSKGSVDMWKPDEAGVLVSTYYMMSYSQERRAEMQRRMDAIYDIDWGLMILDEVQMVPANQFRLVTSRIKSRCKLGLTATLVREDDRIIELNYLIGPKLYEANWLDLTRQGYLANVQCIEVWCEMTPDFYKEYLARSRNQKMMYYVCNPNKLIACDYLIQLHEARGDKIIVFADSVFAQEYLAKALKRPFINGSTNQLERMNILQYFQKYDTINTIFVSKIGDTSIDLPSANVVIQISSHFASRKQEA